MQDEKTIDSLEHIRVGVFSSKDLLDKSVLDKTFDDMDREIWNCIGYLLDSPCRFVEDRLAEVAVRSMGNMTYGRVLYNKDEHSTDNWNLMCGELLHLVTCEKTAKNVDKLKTLLQKMCWVRAIYEELIEEFISITDNYKKSCVEEAKIINNSNFHFLSSKLTKLRIGKRIVEDAIGLDSQHLYGTVSGVLFHREKYLESRNTIINPFLRLVFAEASKISGPAKSMLAADVFQAGVFGLIRAISTFFKERQAYFSAYARWWVRQSILLSLKEEVSFFKIPSAVWHVYNKMERGEKVEEDQERIRQYVDVIKLVPIDQPVQQEGNTARLLDTLIDSDQEQRQEARELNETLTKMLSGLDPKSERYICLKFGLISHLRDKISIKKEDILKEQIRQTLALLSLQTRQS